MTQQEEYVRARWERVFDRETIVAGHGWMVRLPIIWHKSLTDGYFKTKAAAWQAAYEFTVAREEEIRLLEEEIAEIEDDLGHLRENLTRLRGVYGRILARLQQALEDLAKEMVKA
jgi:hypothetical protein